MLFRSTVANLVKNCIIIAALSLFLFFLISLFLSHWAVKPVDKAWQQQRQFVADASHELKTPLTVIMTNAELLQSEDQDPLEKQRFSDNILSTSHRMRSLIENLLDLAGPITALPNRFLKKQISAKRFIIPFCSSNPFILKKAKTSITA